MLGNVKEKQIEIRSDSMEINNFLNLSRQIQPVKLLYKNEELGELECDRSKSVLFIVYVIRLHSIDGYRKQLEVLIF